MLKKEWIQDIKLELFNDKYESNYNNIKIKSLKEYNVNKNEDYDIIINNINIIQIFFILVFLSKVQKSISLIII